MTPFSESSYLAQVRRLRAMANMAIEKYPIKNFKLKFIGHGENAIFKIETSKKDYLLRLHRNDYHTKAGIEEELKWLKDLSTNSVIPVQTPLLSKSKQLITSQKSDVAPERFCSILEWLPGKKRYISLTPKSFYRIGLLTAQLHNSAKRRKCKHRNFWTADGLIGKECKLGSISNLKSIVPKDYHIIEKCRILAYQEISNYIDNNPRKLSLIHADLHFSNLLWHKDKLHPIDFDDCGHGPHPYDLAVTIDSSSNIFKRKGKTAQQKYTNALLNGYNSAGEISDADIKVLPYLILARKIITITWLNNRSDNPRLLKTFNKVIQPYISDLKEDLKGVPKLII